MFVDSNLTRNLKELKDSCRQQSEELNDLLIQRDQLQKERTINGEHKDALVNDNTQERPSVASPSGARDPTKRPKKDEADLGFEDEVLQLEDLEPPGVSASKVSALAQDVVQCKIYSNNVSYKATHVRSESSFHAHHFTRKHLLANFFCSALHTKFTQYHHLIFLESTDPSLR